MKIRTRSASVALVGALLLGVSGQVAASAAPASSPDQEQPVTVQDLPVGAESTYEVELIGDPVIETYPETDTAPAGVSLLSTCPTKTTYRSAIGTRKVSGVTLYRNYLDVMIKYNCKSVRVIDITGATAKPVLAGISKKGVGSKTEVVNGRYARAKAAYNYRAGVSWLGSDLTSCLGINVVRSSAALTVSNDTSCRSNP